MRITAWGPTVIYDDMCGPCTRFARIVAFLGRGRISMIGHYSKKGASTRDLLGSQATEMFWFVEKNTAFGGRAALIPLLFCSIRALAGRIPHSESGSVSGSECTACAGYRSVFLRSASMIRHSQKISV